MSDVNRRDVELYRGLEPVLGADIATLLLERLPPPHEELAVQSKVDRRFEQVDRRFEQVDLRFDRIDERFDRIDVEWGLRLDALKFEVLAALHQEIGRAISGQTRTLLVGISGIMFAAAGLAAALAQLF